MPAFTLRDSRDLFIAGEGGYHTYRIPALLVAPGGVLLAFCEGRRDGTSDTGQIDLLLTRSVDGGDTWEAPRAIISEPEMTCGNPCPAVDASRGTVILTLTKNRADEPQDLIEAGQGRRTVWTSMSTDDGATWSAPVEISAQVQREGWTWYATGPGHGVQMSDGRIVIPCDHVRAVAYRRGDPKHSHVILSDDGGASWRVGGIIEQGTNECAAAVLPDGTLYLNCRNYNGQHRRAVAWSADGGETFTPMVYDDALIEPVCQAALTRRGEVILFSNPASDTRDHLTLRASLDAARTWPVRLLLHEGKAAYSDLAVLPDGTICCLYERGEKSAYERLTLARVGWED